MAKNEYDFDNAKDFLFNQASKINEIISAHNLTLNDIPSSLLHAIFQTRNYDALETFCSTGMVSLGEVYGYGSSVRGWNGAFDPQMPEIDWPTAVRGKSIQYITFDELSSMVVKH